MLIQASNPLNGSTLIFAALECVHILGFALSIGTIAIVDFRLLGMGLIGHPAAELAKTLAPWTRVGLAIMLLSGPAMFFSDPDTFYRNSAFQIKIVLLLFAIIFNSTIHRRVVSKGPSPGRGRAVAYISLALWTSVLTGGLFIGFVGRAIPR